MDYVPGLTVEECWDNLDSARQQSIAAQVATIIETMQRAPLDLPPEPIGGTEGYKFEGPWFTDYGAGLFATLQELKDWCNHKIDVCIQFKQLPEDAPRFTFRSVVFTHQDIALRNLIIDVQDEVWLVDWAFAGAYPPGFEQALLPTQSTRVFADMVLQRLSDRQEQVMGQFSIIAYGLSVAA